MSLTVGELSAVLDVDRDRFSRGLGRAESDMRGFGGRISGFFGQVASSSLGFLTGQALYSGMRAIGRGMSSIVGGAVDMNSTLETSKLQFETLLGSAEDAEAHVASLFEFAKRTPFETQPIIDASRMLQTFGGDALNTEAMLNLVGDAAAGASVGMDEIAFWTGRAYAAIQGGQPFGEARMRLQEMALLTPEAAARMEELQKSGADAAEVWAVMEEELGRFTGAMDKQQGSWKGLTSTLKDVVQLNLATAFKPLFDLAKEGVGGLIAFLESPSGASMIERIARGVSSFASGLEIAVRVVSGMLSGEVDPAEYLGRIGENVIQWLSGLAGRLVQAAGPIVDGLLRGLMTALPRINEAVTEWGLALINWVGPMLPGLIDALGGLLNTILDFAVNQALPALVERVTLWGGAMIRWVVDALPGLIDNLGDLLVNLLGWIGDQLPVLAENLGKWGGELVAWILPRIPDILLSLGQVILRVAAWIITDGVPALVTAAWNLGSGLVSGILDGLGNLASVVWEKIKGGVQWAIDKAKDFFGISSPSRVTADVLGRPLAEGVAVGLTDGTRDALAAFDSMSAQIVARASVGVPGIDRAGSFAPSTDGALAAAQTTLVLTLPDGTELGRWVMEQTGLGGLRTARRTM